MASTGEIHKPSTGAEPTRDDVARPRRKLQLPPAEMRLNLTAMIDVIFQLLIYFVVTASFSVGEGVVTAKLPQGGPQVAASRPPQRPLEIRLTEVGVAGVQVTVTGHPAMESFDTLQRVLAELQHEPTLDRYGVYRPDSPVVIRPMGQVRWQHVVNAFNAAIAAQYSNVRFAPPPSA